MQNMKNKKHSRIYRFLRAILRPLIRNRFGYEYDERLLNIDGPVLILSNHNTDLDPIFVGCALNEQLSFVASEHITHKGFVSKILLHYVDIITIVKGKTALNTTKQMINRLKNGMSVLIFPEGNRSFNGVTGKVDSSCGKIARIAGANLITVRIEGGYLTQPRWGKGFRKGKIRVHYVNSYSPGEIKAMSEDEICRHINEDLYEDAFETQKTSHICFEGKDVARGLETTLFLCPDCHSIGKMKTDSDTIYCTECGFRAVLNKYGEISGDSGCPETIKEWDELQHSYIKENPTVEFDDNVEVFEVKDDHSSVMLYKGKFILPDSIEGMAIYSRNVLVIHSGEKHLEVKGGDDFNALKYLYRYNESINQLN